MTATWLKFLSFAFILILSSEDCWSQMTAYIGIAGSGSGVGTAGHGFLVVAPSPGDFVDAIADRYEVVLPKNFKVNAQSILKLNSLRFVINRSAAWAFIREYEDQNRYVHLFELKLDANQVEQLIRNVDSDRLDREQNVRTDYRVEGSNCLTKLYDQINKVIDPKFAIRYSSIKTAPYNFSYLHPNEVASVVPLSAAMVLQNHPAVRRVFKFQPIDMDRIHIAIALRQSLGRLLSACGVSSSESSELTELATSRATLVAPAYLSFLSQKLQPCLKQSTARVQWTSLLYLMSYYADNSTFSSRVDQILQEF